MSSTDRPRTVLGVPVSVPVLLLLLVGFGIATLIGMAVIQWLERSA